MKKVEKDLKKFTKLYDKRTILYYRIINDYLPKMADLSTTVLRGGKIKEVHNKIAKWNQLIADAHEKIVVLDNQIYELLKKSMDENI